MTESRFADAFDRVVRDGVTQRRRAELRATLAARGLSDEELDRVAPYVDYVARHAGTWWLLPVLFVPTLVAGAVTALVAPAGATLALALTGGAVLVLGAAARRHLRRRQRARRIREELLADPEPFLDGDPPRHLTAAG